MRVHAEELERVRRTLDSANVRLQEEAKQLVYRGWSRRQAWLANSWALLLIPRRAIPGRRVRPVCRLLRTETYSASAIGKLGWHAERSKE